MAARIAKLLVAILLVAGLWSLNRARPGGGESWVRAAGTARGPVRILRFYSTAGSLEAGEKALLCYAVENARLVRIAPLLEGALPSTNRCLEIVPLRTTHYAILAEGFDGRVAMQFLTLAVYAKPVPTPPLDVAANRRIRSVALSLEAPYYPSTGGSGGSPIVAGEAAARASSSRRS